MTIKNLTDLKPGDIIAFKQHYAWSWYKDEVSIVTERCIIIKSEPDVKFKKNNGLATRKDEAGYQISVVTPEIQDDWDRREYQRLIRDTLQSATGNTPLEAIKEATIILLSQNEYSKSLYAQCLREMISTHSASSETLNKVLRLLQNAVNQ